MNENINNINDEPGIFISEEDLKNLSLRALVAFAARSARRVHSLYLLPFRHPDKELHSASIDEAIKVADRFSSGIARDHLYDVARESANSAREAAVLCQELNYNISFLAAAAATNAASAAYVAVSTFDSPNEIMLEAMNAATNLNSQRLDSEFVRIRANRVVDHTLRSV